MQYQRGKNAVPEGEKCSTRGGNAVLQGYEKQQLTKVFKTHDYSMKVL
jgi:hypothetical protein